MAWLIVDQSASGGAGQGDSGAVHWHIISGETIVIQTRREIALNGQLLLQGALIINGTGRLRLNQ